MTEFGIRQRVKASSVADFGRVAVMFGGFSSEREVSLDTGAAVLQSLVSRGVDASPWDPAENDMRKFAGAGFDRVWIALHGPGGEDGAIQGALQWHNTPYTGSGVMASALAMDKIRSKHLFRAAGIATPDYAIVDSHDDARAAAEKLGYPMFFKPSDQGSSVGLSKVSDVSELSAAVDTALQFGGAALAETCLAGDEYTVGVLQGEALPSIRIETPRSFYDYRAKYESERTRYHCPGASDAQLENELRNMALLAFEALGCSGWGRVDFMLGNDGRPQVLEVNTVPGMTSHSLVPMGAAAVGIDFAELCWRILETSLVAQDDTLGVAANDA